MASKHAPAEARPDVAARLIEDRYGGHRAAIGSIMFVWVNLSLLMAFGWAALVVAVDAPAVGVEALPFDWFIVRFMIMLAAAWLVVKFWSSSMVPMESMSRERAEAVFQRGVLWTQGMLFLLGVTGVLAVLLLLINPARASQLLVFGVVEVFAVQALFSGFVKTALDVLLDRARAFVIVTGLFAAFFGLQSLAIAITSVDGGQSYYLALAAGAFLGMIVGAVSLALRARSGSILPGFLVQLLMFYVLIPYLE